MEEIKVGRFQIQCNHRIFVQGCLVTLLGLILPGLVTAYQMGIYQALNCSMAQEDDGLLLLSALLLVLMNSVRAVPNYLGVFLLNESLRVSLNGKRRFSFNVLFTISFILLLYQVINWIYQIRYDFGITALVVVAFVLFLSYLDLFSVHMINKFLLLLSLLISIWWLDVVNFLDNSGFGHGEVSNDIKMAARVMGAGRVLDLFAICMFVTFFFASLMQVQLLYKEHKLKISNERTIQVEKELYDAQINALKVRNYGEVRSLVHDLKTPLTTIQGLISLVELMETESQVKEYFKKISEALSSMDMMISEILYENKKSPLATAELMRMVLAQISILVPENCLEYANACPEEIVMGNRIRLSRALINVITNAWYAVEQRKGKIKIQVLAEGDAAVITVEDNGIGISREKMDRIWEIGYSGRDSTGLGLAFTRQVVENHGGEISIDSEEGQYTKVTVRLRREAREYEQ